MTSRAFPRSKGVGGRGWIADKEENALVGSMEVAFASELLNLREGVALTREKTRETFGGQGQRPAQKNVLDGSVTQRLCLLLPFSVGVRLPRSGVNE